MKKGGVLLRLLSGGNANYSAAAGLAYANSNNTPSNANTNISSQLSSLLKIAIQTLPLGKR